jgi:putative transposase
VAAKVELVAQVRPVAGLALALRAVGLARSSWYYRAQHPWRDEERYAALRGPLEQIARTHPDYGYRRTTTELRERLGQRINQKVVRRLHRLWDLALHRRIRPPRPSAVRQAVQQAGRRANLLQPDLGIVPLGVLYTDFTELRYGCGKAWLMTLLDHVTKVVVGWALGVSADTTLALRAWRRARRWLRRHGFPIAGVIVHHDQDPVYTGYGWLTEVLLRDGVRVSYALHGCRDTPEMESFHSRLKTENRSLLLEADSLTNLERVVNQRIRYYNAQRRHSSLENQAPLTVLARLTTKTGTRTEA